VALAESHAEERLADGRATYEGYAAAVKLEIRLAIKRNLGSEIVFAGVPPTRVAGKA
jgi:hypothetical protein